MARSLGVQPLLREPYSSQTSHPSRTDSDFSLAGKILVLRTFRLRHIPPALYSTELIAESGAPVIAIEYGNVREPILKVSGLIPRIRLEARWVRFLPRRARALAIFLSALMTITFKVLTQGRPSLVIAEGIQEECLAVFLHFLFRIAYVAHVHEAYERHELDKLSGIFHAIGSRSLNRADLVIFPEESRAQVYQDRYRLKHPASIVFNCPRLQTEIAPVDLRQKLSLPPDAFLLGYLGGIGRSNAMEEVIMALAELPRVHLLVWGWSECAYQQSLKKIARQLGVERRLLFLGQLNEDKLSHLAGCDASYCIYRPDRLRLRFAATASNKLMESLAAAVPVITSSTPDFKKMVEKYEVGICANSISARAVVEAIRILQDSPDLRAYYSQNARYWHRKLFNYETQFSPALHQIRQLAGLSPPPI